jgi:tetratricopeptide (TPR) repeat protein
MSLHRCLLPWALLLFLLPCSPAPAQELPRVLIQRGERFLAMGNLDGAIANYSRVVACCEGTADAAEAHNDLGVAYARKGDPYRAIQEYEAALAINGYPLALFNLGKAWRGRFEQDGDPAARQRALDAFQAFGAYLDRGQDLPPVVAFQKAEIKEYLQEAKSALSR